ncbi:MAG TPA: type II secretion system F family protein [Anaerolineae bacterium]
MSDSLDQFDNQILELLQVLEAALRSGYSLVQSLEIAAKDMADPMAAEARRVTTELQSGVALPDALNHWLQRFPSRNLDLIVATILAQLEAGGNLANRFQLLSQIIPKLKHV